MSLELGALTMWTLTPEYQAASVLARKAFEGPQDGSRGDLDPAVEAFAALELPE